MIAAVELTKRAQSWAQFWAQFWAQNPESVRDHLTPPAN